MPHDHYKNLRLTMKTTLAIITLALASCGPAPESWRAGPNPLNSPDIDDTPPESMGRFGPHFEHYR